MKITKDEARILCIALEIAKFEINYPNGFNIFDKFKNLETRLYNYSKDNRRNGRTSQNDFSDVLKRYKPKNIKNEPI